MWRPRHLIAHALTHKTPAGGGVVMNGMSVRAS